MIARRARKPDKAVAEASAKIGTAGWSLPLNVQSEFSEGGSHLERYAQRFTAAEINSSFHRSHRSSTYERWAASVPNNFRFSAKIPKTITHKQRLVDSRDLLQTFLEEASPLGAKLGCLLVQLPPSLEFHSATAGSFFEEARTLTHLPIACEPRHGSWFTPEADGLLRDLRVVRVAADPVKNEGAERPGGWGGFTYFRLHGSPKMYYSAYSASYIETLARHVSLELSARRDVWCIFDNTTLGAATPNALQLSRRLTPM